MTGSLFFDAGEGGEKRGEEGKIRKRKEKERKKEENKQSFFMTFTQLFGTKPKERKKQENKWVGVLKNNQNINIITIIYICVCMYVSCVCTFVICFWIQTH